MTCSDPDRFRTDLGSEGQNARALRGPWQPLRAITAGGTCISAMFGSSSKKGSGKQGAEGRFRMANACNPEEKADDRNIRSALQISRWQLSIL